MRRYSIKDGYKMESIILLIAIIVLVMLQQVAKKNFNIRTHGKGAYLFTGMSALSAAVFFVCSAGFKLDMNPALIPYSIGFAVTYGMTVMFSMIALNYGSMSLTSLVTSYSLIIPTFYGLLFLGDPSGPFLYVGLVLLFASLTLINLRKGDMKISGKWFFYAVLAFAGNGICSTVQKQQQLDFDGAYKSEFMIIALLMVSAACFILAYAKEKENIVSFFKKGTIWMVLCGAFNGACNLFVMMLSALMAASLMFPLISAGGIILTYIVSRFAYKEKLSLNQNIGVVLGVAAVIFLNL